MSFKAGVESCSLVHLAVSISEPVANKTDESSDSHADRLLSVSNSSGSSLFTSTQEDSHCGSFSSTPSQSTYIRRHGQHPLPLARSAPHRPYPDRPPARFYLLFQRRLNWCLHHARAGPVQRCMLRYSRLAGCSDSHLRQVSGVSSFNYPAAADPTLLTPVSSAGSPPLQPRQAAKSMGNYHQSQSAAPGPQIPTPPNTSKMYYTPYDINTSSQDSSPMTVHPVSEAPAFDMATYMAHSPPGSHHPSSPKTDVPPPIDPYLGHFTVSGGNEPEVPHHSFPSYSYPNVELDPRLYVGQQQQPHQPTHMPVSAPSHLHHHLTPAAPPSTLTRPHQSTYRTEPGPRIEDLRGNPTIAIGHYSSHRHRSSGGIRKKVSPTRKPSRTPKGTPQVGSLDGQGGFGDEEDRDELILRDDAPEDDKYLFQLRKEFISEKGKGMWEEMKAKYSEKHQGNWEKAALQMKVSRAVAKFGVWPNREVSSANSFFPISHANP